MPLDNIQALSSITLPSGQQLEFILVVPGRRYSEFVDVLADFDVDAQQAKEEVFGQSQWQGMRLVMAHNPDSAIEQTQRRLDDIKQLQQRAQQLTGKLDAQDAGVIRGCGQKVGQF